MNNTSTYYTYLLTALGKKGGFDECRFMLQTAFVTLILNKPFNFSVLIFYHLIKSCIARHYKKIFLMYPQILQIIIDDVGPDLIRD